MSKYTTELRWAVEQKLKDKGKDNVEQNWGFIYEDLGLADYPIFDELYRPTLNDKIIRHYYFREIGAETLAQFRWFMRRTMHEIMPYYNQLYKSKDLVTDPMLGTREDYLEMYRNDYEGENANVSGSNSRNVFEDTPMNMLDTGAIENLDYATNVTYDKNDASSNGTNSGDNYGWKTHNREGFNQSQSKLLLEYRKTFINIDMDVISELETLFMGLW